MLQISLIFIFLMNLWGGELYYYQKSKKIFITPIIENNKIIVRSNSIKFFKTNDNKVIGIDNKFFLKLKKNCDIYLLKQKYNFKIEKNITSKLYLLKAIDTKESIKLSIKLKNDKCIEYAHPNIYKTYKRR